MCLVWTRKKRKPIEDEIRWGTKGNGLPRIMREGRKLRTVLGDEVFWCFACELFLL